MIGFIAWQTALGFYVLGLISGWVLSIYVANRIIKNRKKKK